MANLKQLEHWGKIISVKLLNETTIEFNTENAIFYLNAIGQCCSESWFEFENDDVEDKDYESDDVEDEDLEDENLEDEDLEDEDVEDEDEDEDENENYENKDYEFIELRGENIVSYTFENINMKKSKRQSCDINEKITFNLESGREFSFILRNSSNGYYSGSIELKFEHIKTLNEMEINSTSKIIIVCGLPYSGKSTYISENYQKYEQIDDFMFDPFYKIKVIDCLKKSKNIVLNDPRLCDLNNFLDLYSFIIKMINSHDRIKIILFENNPKQCLINSKSTYSYYSYQIDNYSKDYKKLENYLRNQKFKLYKDNQPEFPLRTLTLKYDQNGVVLSIYPFEYALKVLNYEATFEDLYNKIETNIGKMPGITDLVDKYINQKDEE